MTDDLKAAPIDYRLVVAEASDAARLLPLVITFHDEDGHPLSAIGADAFERLCTDPALGFAVAIESGETLIGYAAVCFGMTSIEYGGRDAFLDDLYIIPAYRGRGSGRRIIDELVGMARSHGVKALHMEVQGANQRAYDLYTTLGFKDRGSRLMTKRLV